MTTNFRFVSLAAATLAMSATAASADILHYQAQLRGAAESPPTASPARGELAAVLDTDRRAFEYTVTYRNLTGPVVVAGFKAPTSAPEDPIVTAPSVAAAKTLHAVVTLTPAQIRDLNDGHWSFDIATSANPGGEIRGKVQRTSVY